MTLKRRLLRWLVCSWAGHDTELTPIRFSHDLHDDDFSLGWSMNYDVCERCGDASPATRVEHSNSAEEISISQ